MVNGGLVTINCPYKRGDTRVFIIINSPYKPGDTRGLDTINKPGDTWGLSTIDSPYNPGILGALLL